MNAPVSSQSLTTNTKAPPALREIAIEDTRGGGMLKPQSFGEVVAFAELMARSQIAIRKHLRNDAGACMAITMQAMRWDMDPFAVANKSYAVNDQIAYEAQLIAAVVLTRAPIDGEPQYTFTGEGPTRRCKVAIRMRSGATLEYESPQFKEIKTKNSPLWTSDPDQQFCYFSIRSWARRHTPQVILGVYDREEIESAEPLRPQERLPAADKLSSRLTGQAGAGFSEAHVRRETGDTIDGQVVTFDDNLRQFEQIVAATTTTADLTALATRVREEPWYRNASDVDANRALAVFNARHADLTKVEEEAAAASNVVESKATSAADAPNKTTNSADATVSEQDTGEVVEESPEQKLLTEARGVATNGVRKLKFWFGKLKVDQAALMEPHRASLMQAAEASDKAL